MANILKNNRLNYFILFIIALITLNSQDHSLNAGLDGSYFWAFNYLFNFNYPNLDKVTFIYGPLAFLHNTLCYGQLILIGTLFQLLAKFALGWAILRLVQLQSLNKTRAFLIFTLCCISMFSGEAYLSLIIALLIVIYHIEKKSFLLYLIGFITFIGYYYKCSIGLTGVLLQGLYWLFAWVQTKKPDYNLFLKIVGVNITWFLVIGLLLFQSFNPILESLTIYYQNIISFNEASSIYNGRENILLLVICGLSLIAIFYFNKKSVFQLFWLLIFFFLYTGFTHSVVRMDHSHYMGFLVYLYMVICLCGLFYEHISKYTFPLLGIAFFSYYGNLNAKKDFSEFFVSIPNGPTNFYNYVLNPNYKKTCRKQSDLNLKHTNKLSAATVFEINNGSVDFFPWDLMFVDANKLNNWKPRPYLQNLNMSDYFDKKTADYFSSTDAPDYLVWHSAQPNNFLAGIDNSYLLNNEFYTISSILSNYKVINTDNNHLILKHINAPIKIWVKDETEKTEINSGEWITLPENDNISGCSIVYDFNLLRGLKKQLYRDDEFFIEYKTATNQKFKKRIWPNDAKNFIWLSPFISDIHDSLGFKNITQVRFTNTNKSIHSGKLKIQFKSLIIETPNASNSKEALFDWFN